jgi:proteic killer suppression protein
VENFSGVRRTAKRGLDERSEVNAPSRNNSLLDRLDRCCFCLRTPRNCDSASAIRSIAWRLSKRLTSVAPQATVRRVKIRNFAHKGLRRLYDEDNGKSLPPDSVDKLRKMLAFLDDMEHPEELRALPSWKPHLLTGNRRGTWSLSVTRNRRLTFRINAREHDLCDLNLEDYH